MPLASLKFLQPRYVLDWLLNFAIILHFIALITPRTAPIVPRGQDRPRISLERSRYLSENCSRNVIADSDSTGPEETSPTYSRANNSNCSPSVLPCRTQSFSPSSGRSSPVNTPLYTINASGSCCDHKRHKFDSLQKKLAALTEKNWQLARGPTAAVRQRRSENLPSDMVVSVRVRLHICAWNHQRQGRPFCCFLSCRIRGGDSDCNSETCDW